MYKIIEKLEKKYKLKEDTTFKKLINYTNYKEIPFQRWFYYQEGFSINLLNTLINKSIINTPIKKIIDPFCGSGTTLVSAKQSAIKSTGIDINPVSAFLSKVKTQHYNKKDILEATQFRLHETKHTADNYYKKYELKIIQKLFSKKIFKQIEDAKSQIKKVRNDKVKEILFATLICLLEATSNYKKAGNGLKRKKKTKETDFKLEFYTKLNQICSDLMSFKSNSISDIHCGDYNIMKDLIEDETTDLFLFSPPYANCFDYFEVYKIELWLGEFVSSYDELRAMRKSALVSNLNANLKKEERFNIKSDLLTENLNSIKINKLHDRKIPKMISLYFQDMYELLSIAYCKLQNKGNIVIVVGNSSYGGVPLLTDLILANIGEDIGYKIKQIIVARKNETSSQQYKRIGEKVKYVRESLIILEK